VVALLVAMSLLVGGLIVVIRGPTKVRRIGGVLVVLLVTVVCWSWMYSGGWITDTTSTQTTR
jgi:hypothetical protein